MFFRTSLAYILTTTLLNEHFDRVSIEPIGRPDYRYWLAETFTGIIKVRGLIRSIINKEYPKAKIKEHDLYPIGDMDGDEVNFTLVVHLDNDESMEICTVIGHRRDRLLDIHTENFRDITLSKPLPQVILPEDNTAIVYPTFLIVSYASMIKANGDKITIHEEIGFIEYIDKTFKDIFTTISGKSLPHVLSILDNYAIPSTKPTFLRSLVMYEIFRDSVEIYIQGVINVNRQHPNKQPGPLNKRNPDRQYGVSFVKFRRGNR